MSNRARSQLCSIRNQHCTSPELSLEQGFFVFHIDSLSRWTLLQMHGFFITECIVCLSARTLESNLVDQFATTGTLELNPLLENIQL